MPAIKTVCVICKHSITKTQGCIECKICSKWVHGTCAKLSDSDLSALKAIKASSFICAICEPNISGIRGSSSSVTDVIHNINSKLDSFDTFIQNYQTDQSALLMRLDEIKNNMESYLTEIKNDVATCNARISSVETSTSTRLDALEAENNALHRRLNRADFLISGLPQGLGELTQYVIALGAALKITLTEKDINHICYVSRGRMIFVKLNSVELRDAIMREYFKSRSLRVCDIMSAPGCDITSRVYLNDHFTPFASSLNSTCNKLRRKNKIVKFKIINGDTARAKVVLPDGKEAVLDINDCNLMMND